MADNQVTRASVHPVTGQFGFARWVRWAVIGVGALFLLVVLAASFFTVEQYERAVVTTWGKFSYTAEPGLCCKVPFVQSALPYTHQYSHARPD